MNDAKTTLRDNTLAIMVYRYETRNLLRMHKESGLPLASVQRIIEGRTSVGVDIVERLARAYGLQPWQLLFPGLDPADPPQAASGKDRKLIAALRRLSRE